MSRKRGGPSSSTANSETTESSAKRPVSGVVKIPLLTIKDADEYRSLVASLTKGVKALGDYSPELDDPLIYQAARALIYVNKSEDYMDSAADAKAFASAADAQSKALKRVQWAIDGLAMNRKARLQDRSVQQVSQEVRAAIERVIGSSPATEKLPSGTADNNAGEKASSQA